MVAGLRSLISQLKVSYFLCSHLENGAELLQESSLRLSALFSVRAKRQPRSTLRTRGVAPQQSFEPRAKSNFTECKKFLEGAPTEMSALKDPQPKRTRKPFPVF